MKFLTDSDSKSFPAVEDIYEGEKIEKLECIGHVEKRVGNRLRNLKRNLKGLGGRRHLTDIIIDKLQNYYEMVIQENSGGLNAMMSAAAASLFHLASSTTNDFYTHCPSLSDSWSTYKPLPGLPMDIIKVARPIYQELCSEILLKKFTYGQTLNRNKTFNEMIWHRVPKHTYVGGQVFETGVHDAAANFSIGNLATLRIIKLRGTEPGTNARLGCSTLNRDRNQIARHHNKTSSKLTRRIVRGISKQKANELEGAERKLYYLGTAK